MDPETVAFETGYADDAIRSFALFERLQQEGVIPPGVKYQACSGTPLAITYMYMSPDARAAFQPIYTRHLLDEISRMADVIPHDQLAYQWDVAPEVLMWEGVFEQPDTYKTDILDSLGAIGNAVPGTIELGYHLCYGSPRDEHVVQPRDLAVSVEIANGILERVERPVQFIHVPVPQDCNDDAFFQPLANLSLPEGTDLYLVGTPIFSAPHVGLAGTIQSSPAIDADSTLYMGSWDGCLYAIQAQRGEIRWRCETRGPVVSSPAIGADGMVYVGCDDGYLYAINATTGKPTRRFDAGGRIRSSPAIANGEIIYVGCDNGRLYAVSTQSYKAIWEVETGAAIRSSPALSAEGVVYVGSEDGHLYAIG